jgi:hypothetical protein
MKEIKNFEDINIFLKNTRERFHEITTPINDIIKDPIDLYIDTINLIKIFANDKDHEHYALEVLMTAFKRTLSSLILLGSGLPKEAHIILRNVLEFVLISIDIIYNSDSLEEWRKTTDENLENHEDWYFSKNEMCNRIKINKNNFYPEAEIALAENIKKEWEKISNILVHAHSYAQIKDLFNGGAFQVFGLKAIEDYKRDFLIYRSFIMNIITILIGIPAYRKLIIESKDSDVIKKSNEIAERYEKMIKEGEVIGVVKRYD